MARASQKFGVDEVREMHPAYRECSRFLLSFLDQKINGVFADAADRLFELASEARSNVEQNRFFEGKREIDRNREDLNLDFIGRVDQVLCEFFDHRQRRTDSHTPPAEEEPLRILDDRDLAVTLAVDNIVDTAEIRLTRELYGLSVRLGHVFDTSPIPNDLSPVSPRSLCEAFRETLLALDVEIEVHQALFKSFEKNIIRALDEIYGALNEIFIEAGVLPELRHEVRRRKQLEKDPAAEIEPEQAQYPQQPGEVVDAGAAIEQRLVRRVQSLLAQRRKQLWPAPSGPAMSAQAIGEVLSTLQSELASLGPQSDLDTHQIKAQLMERAAQDGTGALAPQVEDTVDLVGMMFDFVRDDRQLPVPFQSALHRLHVPFLRAALNDPNAILGPETPARRLLETLGELGKGWNSRSDRRGELIAQVNEVVERVVHEFWDDDDTLTELVAELENYKAELDHASQKRAELARQQLRGREQLRFARHNVAKLLQRRTRDKTLPPLINDLLNRAWAHVMVLESLRHGVNSPEWKQAVTIAEELIWSVTFERDERAVKRLRTRVPVLSRALSEGLKKVGYQDSEIRKLLINLQKLYVQTIRETGSDRIVIEADEQGVTIRGENIMEQAILDETPIASNEEELQEFFDSVRHWHTGQWVMFHREHAEPLRAKLSW
ncbi:MAG: DUF1631 family protein, partial [Xanthomonadales bacterium]|nr:DUF1631 family protein [Xanthomonadales bacterium]